MFAFTMLMSLCVDVMVVFVSSVCLSVPSICLICELVGGM